MHPHRLFMPCFIAAALGLYPFLSSSALHPSDRDSSGENPLPHRLQSLSSQNQPRDTASPTSEDPEENPDDDYVDMAAFDKTHQVRAHSGTATAAASTQSPGEIPNDVLRRKFLHCGRPGDLDKSFFPAAGHGITGPRSSADKRADIFSPSPARKPAPPLPPVSQPFPPDSQ